MVHQSKENKNYCTLEEGDSMAKAKNGVARPHHFVCLRQFFNKCIEDFKEYEKRCPILCPNDMHDYESEGEHEIEDVDMNRTYKILAYDIKPYIKMAMQAYEDTCIANACHIVKESQLIKNLTRASRLFNFLPITTDTEVHVCTLVESGSVAFVFRGTEPIAWMNGEIGDILTDLAQHLKPLELYDASTEPVYKAPQDIKVHKGFQLAFKDVTSTSRYNENLKLVLKGLGMEAKDVLNVKCIGHSLGGALATLCAYWCRYVAFPKAKISCITIGSPRVGNLEFAKNFNNKVADGGSYRLVNKGDIVPSLPHLFTYPKMGSHYKHVKGLIHFSEHPTSKDSISLRRGGQRPRSLRSFRDHPCAAYLISSEKALANFQPK